MTRTRAPKFRRHINPVIWLLRHAQMSLSALGRLSRQPIASAMTALVIGIAIALPAGMHLMVDNVRHLSSSWEGSASISLFLNHTVTDTQADEVQRIIQARTEVAEATLISREQALDEFRRLSGFGDALDLLDSNPLPPVVLVRPSDAWNDPERTAELAHSLEQYKEIDIAQVDLQWVRRLDAIAQTVERGVLVLAGLLGIAVLLIVGNTIRLEILNRHAEIEIVKLVGGTDAFIRRPFLYEGLWYGLLGGIIALVLVVSSLSLLQGPVQHLAGLYSSDLDLDLLNSTTFLALAFGSPLLGLGGAWLAVGRHLSAIQPE